jgi:hypothetical protein
MFIEKLVVPRVLKKEQKVITVSHFEKIEFQNSLALKVTQS